MMRLWMEQAKFKPL